MQHQLLCVMCACVCTGLVGWISGSGVQQEYFLSSKLMVLFIPSSPEKLEFFLAEECAGCCRFAVSEPTVELRWRSSVHESKANNVEFPGMSWECPLSLMAPHGPPHGRCQLWRAVGWQQGTWRSCSDRVMLRLGCRESLRLSWSFGRCRRMPVGRKNAGPSSAPATGWFLVDCAFFVAFVEGF